MELTLGLRGRFEFDVITGEARLHEQSQLLNRSFKVPAGSSFYDDFPVWNERFGRSILKVGAYRSGRLVSTASIREAALKLPSGRSLPVGMIGAVATDEKWRGCGAASQAVALALLWAKEKKLPLVVLWGSEHALYQKLGFELCGEQLRIALDKLPPSSLDLSEFQIHREWSPALFDCLKERPSGLYLSEDDRPWVTAHKNVQWWWVEKDGGGPLCCAAVGRGIDLNNIIHEWGGEKETLLALFQHIHKNAAAKELIGSKFLFKKYGINNFGGSAEYLCLAKALDPGRIFSAFHPEESASLPALSNSELVQILFGPGFDGVYWNKNLPLPLWFWGLDSA